jgi:hypothetical protein
MKGHLTPFLLGGLLVSAIVGDKQEPSGSMSQQPTELVLHRITLVDADGNPGGVLTANGFVFARSGSSHFLDPIFVDGFYAGTPDEKEGKAVLVCTPNGIRFTDWVRDPTVKNDDPEVFDWWSDLVGEENAAEAQAKGAGWAERSIEIDSDRCFSMSHAGVEMVGLYFIPSFEGDGKCYGHLALGKQDLGLTSTVGISGNNRFDTGGSRRIVNKTNDTVVELTVDDYGHGLVGAYDREGKGRVLTPR